MNIVSIGEVLWDVVGETEHLGGAPFNFAAHLSQLGHRVSFISAVGKDEKGDRILDRMAGMALATRYVHRVRDYPTGTATVTIDAQNQPRFVIHRPAAYDFPQLSDADFIELASVHVDWIYFGTLQQMSLRAKELTARLINCNRRARRFYDVNLRPDSWQPSLVQESMALASVVKFNDTELEELAQAFGPHLTSFEEFCRAYSAKFGWEAVCITRGAKGCVLLIGDQYIDAPGYSVTVRDTVGAGDAFAAAFVHGLGSGWPAPRVADFANRVGALVASRAGAIPSWTIEEAASLRPRCSH
ncbi:MAG TPA: carbohydrate kinase [Terriglobales bacterium]|nr:carbohydrate kinase [Terriglobales bacterium]